MYRTPTNCKDALYIIFIYPRLVMRYSDRRCRNFIDRNKSVLSASERTRTRQKDPAHREEKRLANFIASTVESRRR